MLRRFCPNLPWARSFTQGWNIGQILDGEVSATIVLRSALPVRIALLRQAQIEAKYDELSAKEKKEFDKKNAQLLTCAACASNYIVSLYSKDIHMSAAFVNDKKKFITLSNDQGQSIELKGFSTREKNPITEVIFFFPRENAPPGFLSPNTSKIIFNMDFRVDDLRGFPVRRAEFDVKDITREGTIVF